MEVTPRDCRYESVVGWARPAYVPRSSLGSQGAFAVNPLTCSSYSTVLLHGTCGCEGSASCLVLSRSSMATDTGMLPSASTVLIGPNAEPRTLPSSLTSHWYENAAGDSFMRPSIPLPYGSSISLYGLNRSPLLGSHAPSTR